MKVAYVVSDLTYPPAEGLHQQTLILLSNLKRRGIEVELHGFVKSLANLDLQAMREEVGVEFTSPPMQKSGSLLASALGHVVLGSRLSKELQNLFRTRSYDLVHCEGILACVIGWRRDGLPSVLSLIDPGSRRNARFMYSSARLSTRLKYAIVSLAFLILEKRLRANNSIWHVVSFDDRRYLQKTHKFSRVVDIPVSLPPELERGVDEAEGAVKKPGEPVIVLVYADLRVNHMREALHDFATQVFQTCRGKAPVSFVIMGRVACDDVMSKWFEGLNYEFIEWAEDYIEVIRRADIVVLPDRVGTGLKNRTVQSMAASVPVLGTSVAFEGIPVENGVEAMVVKSPSDGVAPFMRLITNPELRTTVGAAGRSRVVEEFGSQNVTKRWIETYSRLLAQPISDA